MGRNWSSFLSTDRDFHLGLFIRNNLDKFFGTLHPYLRIVIPNFKVAHYVYIVFFAILCSVVMYPVRNGRYIDMLFFGTGAATQSGLNTIDINQLYLYQQIVLYTSSFFTTPIFIHGFVLFLRLYWFERYFDNIKESSKLNFKMRRSATLNPTLSEDPTRLNTVNNQGLGFEQRGQPLNNIDSIVSGPSGPRIIIPVDSSPHTSDSTYLDKESEKDVEDSPTVDQGIKFTDLPHPRRRKSDFNPAEMSRSIAMMRNVNPPVVENDDDEVLIIKAPNEIEMEEYGPIYTKKPNQISFAGLTKPSHARKNQRRRRLSSHFKQRGYLRGADTSRDDEDENDSIDSELDDNMDATELSAASHDGSDEDIDAEDEETEIRKATSNVTPSSQPNSGHKNVKRANTLDVTDYGSPSSRSTLFTNRPMSRLKSRLSRSFTSGNQMTDEESLGSRTLSRHMSTNYLSWDPTVGRNSTFVDLTDEQKEELGGVEYRAVKTLIKIICSYYLLFHLFGAIAHLGWILAKPHYISIVREAGVSPTWWAFFAASSSFNDVGFTLTPNSMISFNRSLYVMIWEAILIVIGNTGFPVLLRFIIWVLFKFAKPLSLYKESLGFLLDHPRRCFTLLFPSGPTWWLLLVLIILNSVDLIFFIILDINNNYIKDIPVGYRVMCGIFQAVSTRTAGLAVVDLSELHVAVQVSYLIMMYISVLPIAISIRRTNVYEEQSLGVYLRDNKEDESDNEKNPQNFIGNHLRNQLSFDLWFIFLAVFIICIAEGSRLDKDDLRFTPFAVLFEVVSAYGTVGLSLGYSKGNASFSGQFSTISKLVIIATMIRGRHRGLPYSLDRAIMLPSDAMHKKDKLQETHALRRQSTIDRSNTQASGSDLFRAITRRGENLLRRRDSTMA